MSDDSFFNNDRYELDKKLDPKRRAVMDRIMSKDNVLTLTNEDLKNEILKDYTDRETIDFLFKWYNHRMKKISDKAELFRKNILMRYSYLPTDKIMKKAHKYAKRLGFTEAEFNTFRRMFMVNTDLYKYELKKYNNKTNMANLLGISYEQADRGRLNINIDDEYVKKIVGEYDKNARLYLAAVTALSKYDKEKFNTVFSNVPKVKNIDPKRCVHPVIAAMFLNEIPYYKSCIVMQNIAYLIKQSKEGKRLPALFKDLRYRITSDESQYTDQTGHIISPIKDLYIRSMIQSGIYQQIVALFSKQYLNADFSHFYEALSLYAPNMFYDYTSSVNIDSSNSVAIIRRIYNAFSLYPLNVTINKSRSHLEEWKDGDDSGKVMVIVKDEDGNYVIKKREKTANEKYEEKIRNEFNTKTKHLQFVFINPPVHQIGVINKLRPDSVSYDDNVNMDMIDMGDSSIMTKYNWSNVKVCGAFAVIINRTRVVNPQRYDVGDLLLGLQSSTTEINNEPIDIRDQMFGAKLKSVVAVKTVKFDLDYADNLFDNTNVDIRDGFHLRGQPFAALFGVGENGGDTFYYSPYDCNDALEDGTERGPFVPVNRQEALNSLSKYAEIIIYDNGEDGISDYNTNLFSTYGDKR